MRAGFIWPLGFALVVTYSFLAMLGVFTTGETEVLAAPATVLGLLWVGR